MQQQIQVTQPPERVLNEAASFFSKRRIKVSDRSEKGFRFGLQGGAGDDSGRVTIASGSGGVSTVTVQADGLGVLAVAEGLVRELRKQARDQGRGAQRYQAGGAGSTMRGDFSGLRERLGMPPERIERPPRPPRPVTHTNPTEAITPPQPMAEPEPAASASAAPEASGGSEPTPLPPHRIYVEKTSSEPETAVLPKEGPEPVKTTPPSAEAAGGVPQAGDVQAGPPSLTAAAHSGAGSPSVGPTLDPSVPGDEGGTREPGGTGTTNS